MPAASEYAWTDHALEQLERRFPEEDKNWLIAGSVPLSPSLVNDWSLDTSGGKSYRINDESGCILAIGEGRYGDPCVITVLPKAFVVSKLQPSLRDPVRHLSVREKILPKVPDIADYWPTPLPPLEIVEMKTTELEPELAAMNAIATALKGLSEPERIRVMAWALAKYVDDPAKEVPRA